MRLSRHGHCRTAGIFYPGVTPGVPDGSCCRARLLSAPSKRAASVPAVQLGRARPNAQAHSRLVPGLDLNTAREALRTAAEGRDPGQEMAQARTSQPKPSTPSAPHRRGVGLATTGTTPASMSKNERRLGATHAAVWEQARALKRSLLGSSELFIIGKLLKGCIIFCWIKEW